MAKKRKYVYFFGGSEAEGNKELRHLLGGKGANLAEMTNLGIPVPPGFTITTEVCGLFLREGKIPPQVKKEIEANLQRLEKLMDKKLGDPENPLLLSVRSGARISMPGMMDTVLNLGLNEETVLGLAKKTNNKRFAYDCYRRFIQMFGNVVLGIPKEAFEEIITEIKRHLAIKDDIELDADALMSIIRKFEQLVKEKTGESFPREPYQQLQMAEEAVFNSWFNERAKAYRALHNIPETLGTACNIQVMVFGNIGKNSGTGVVFTRSPATGERKIYGEFLLQAQGEDVVAGVRTPLKIEKLREIMPSLYRKLSQVCKQLESHYKDMQDIEFTVEEGKLYILQTRRGQRTAQAEIKISVDMQREKLISREEAIMRVTPRQLEQLLHPIIPPEEKVEVIAKGLPASPGAVSGKVVFTAEDAIKEGETSKVILVRKETNPDDIQGIIAAEGVLTSRGGMTSHAAVVTRGMGKCCVAGCEAIVIDEKEEMFKVGSIIIKKGDWITLDGGDGRVIKGKIKTVQPTWTKEFTKLMSWADSIRKLRVRANADYPKDAKLAREYGAEGIGLCRTEHMFFGEERLPYMRQMILAETCEEREKALTKLLPLQREDFLGIFKEMSGLPVTIRLLDPPLHEFLPNREELQLEILELKNKKKASQKVIEEKEKLLKRVTSLSEANPMLGHRGCRLGITYPEIIKMQARAVFEAALEARRLKYKPIPEIMIPVVGIGKEVALCRQMIEEVAQEVLKDGKKIPYSIGTMIELPRAAVVAGEIAREAEFFSFGTNDLTQTTFGFSRDDAEGKFIVEYVKKGILKNNPFEVLDQEGVGALIELAVKNGRKARNDLKIGICGEHGGEPSSIEFCDKIGLDYVSCSPFRVPTARLAAAQATIKFQKEKETGRGRKK